jgi:hypothetical protein
MPLDLADAICEVLAAPVGAALLGFVAAAPELEAADELEGAALVVEAGVGVLLLLAAVLAEGLVLAADEELSFMLDDFLLFLVPASLDAVVEGTLVDSEAPASDFLLVLLLLVGLVASEPLAEALV